MDFALMAILMTGPLSMATLMLILAVILKPAAPLPAMLFVSVVLLFPDPADVNPSMLYPPCKQNTSLLVIDLVKLCGSAISFKILALPKLVQLYCSVTTKVLSTWLKTR